VRTRNVAGSRGRSRRSGDRWDSGAAKRYPRSVRVNEILREVLADELERMEDNDERLGLLTVTAVRCDPDLRHALVLFSSLGEEEERALAQCRVRLQAAVSTQVRLKRTPQLRFAADPAVAEGLKIEEILRRLPKGPGVNPTTRSDQVGPPVDG
jgi:ribosome-binding factor A